jgi:hypothetical protein
MPNYLYIIFYVILSIVGFFLGTTFGLAILEATELSSLSFLSPGTGVIGAWYGIATLNSFRKRLRLKRFRDRHFGSNRLENTIWALSAVIADILLRPLLALLSAIMVIFSLGTTPASIISGVFVCVFTWAFVGVVIDSIWIIKDIEQNISDWTPPSAPKGDRG